MGGWIAQRTSAGDRVVLAFATDGAAGLTGPGSSDTLDRLRRREADAAAAALGVQHVVWLGYDASGMADQPSWSSRRFVDAPVEDAARQVAALLDREGAEILTGYDGNGGYGHTD